MPKIGARCHIEEHENEVSATSNMGFLRKELKRYVLVFGVSGGGSFASKNKNHLGDRTRPHLILLRRLIRAFRFPTWNFGLWACHLKVLVAKIREGN
jgi:hypothetical protein